MTRAPALREPDRHGAAKTAAGAGDDGDLLCDVHGCLDLFMGKILPWPLFFKEGNSTTITRPLVSGMHIPLLKRGTRGGFSLCDKNSAPLLDSQLPLHFTQQRHVMGDAHRHMGFLGLLLNEAPFDAEIVVGEHAVLAEARLGEFQ